MNDNSHTPHRGRRDAALLRYARSLDSAVRVDDEDLDDDVDDEDEFEDDDDGDDEEDDDEDVPETWQV